MKGPSIKMSRIQDFKMSRFPGFLGNFGDRTSIAAFGFLFLAVFGFFRSKFLF